MLSMLSMLPPFSLAMMMPIFWWLLFSLMFSLLFFFDDASFWCHHAVFTFSMPHRLIRFFFWLRYHYFSIRWSDFRFDADDYFLITLFISYLMSRHAITLDFRCSFSYTLYFSYAADFIYYLRYWCRFSPFFAYFRRWYRVSRIRDTLRRRFDVMPFIFAMIFHYRHFFRYYYFRCCFFAIFCHCRRCCLRCRRWYYAAADDAIDAFILLIITPLSRYLKIIFHFQLFRCFPPRFSTLSPLFRLRFSPFSLFSLFSYAMLFPYFSLPYVIAFVFDALRLFFYYWSHYYFAITFHHFVFLSLFRFSFMPRLSITPDVFVFLMLIFVTFAFKDYFFATMPLILMLICRRCQMMLPLSLSCRSRRHLFFASRHYCFRCCCFSRFSRCYRRHYFHYFLRHYYFSPLFTIFWCFSYHFWLFFADATLPPFICHCLLHAALMRYY